MEIPPPPSAMSGYEYCTDDAAAAEKAAKVVNPYTSTITCSMAMWMGYCLQESIHDSSETDIITIPSAMTVELSL